MPKNTKPPEGANGSDAADADQPDDAGVPAPTEGSEVSDPAELERLRAWLISRYQGRR